MKTKYLLILLTLGLGIGLALLWILGGASAPAVAGPYTEGQIEALSAPAAEDSTEPAKVLRVCPSDCTYSSIQDAVDAAGDGDLIKVATGTYTDVNHHGGLAQVVYIDKTVTVRGGYTVDNWAASNPLVNPTTLNAGGQGRVLYITGDISPTVEGLRITGGDAYGLPGQSTGAGGGMYVVTATAVLIDNYVFYNTAENGGGVCLNGSDATVTDNIISRNAARGGGGLLLWSSDAVLSGNTVTNNTAETYGGGLYLDGRNATISDNTITNNTAGRYGGGLYLQRSDATLSRNAITNNTADDGGGVFLLDSAATIGGNTVSGNTAISGGGLFLDGSSAALGGNTIINNTANSRGGGLYLQRSDATVSDNTVTGNTAEDHGGGLYLGEDARDTLINNIVADNQANRHGSGLCVGGFSHLLHNTIARNTGGDGSGVYVSGGTVALINTTLVSHSVGIRVNENSTAIINGVLWHNTPITVSQPVTSLVTVQNQHTGNPAFVDPDNGDYHIGPTSAAVDAGVACEVSPLCLRDIDGDPRPAAFGSDIGADERPGASLHIQKVAWPPLLNPGRTLTYTLLITSTGVDTATDIWLSDTLPALQQAVAITTTWGSCTNGAGWGGTLTCNLGTMTPGDSARVTLTAQVTTTLPAQLPWRMRNTVQIRAAETSNTAYTDTMLHNCHVRLNDGPTEYSTIQAGVDASTQPSDVVKVAGCCTGVTSRAGVAQIVYLDKTLVLQGGWNTAFTQRDVTRFPTTLDAWGQGRALYITTPASGAGISPTVEGLRLTGGDASGLGGAWRGWLWHIPQDTGGGVYVNATTTFRNNQVFSNTAHFGGGLGLYGSDAVLSGNGITDNTADYGGGLYLEGSTPTLTGNTITDNTADEAGGGLSLYWSDATISGNTISNNTANYIGGGLSLYLSDATLINNVIVNNQATAAGSGLYIGGSSPGLLHNTIARNTGGDGSGVYVTFATAAEHWDVGSNVALTNTILVSHTVGITFTAGNTATLEGTLWGTGAWANDIDWGGEGTILTGTVNLWGDPAFVSPANGDYHIGPGSAAIDAGVDAGVTTDIDGDPRPLGGGYDLGADEAGLFVTKQARPDPVQPGAPLTYTIHITNATGIDLHATITDTLPFSVTLDRASGGTLILPGGTLTPPDGTVDLPDGRVAVVWTDVITAPDGLWTGTIVVTVDEGYVGPVANLVEATTKEGVAGSDSVTVIASRRVYLPMVLRES